MLEVINIWSHLNGNTVYVIHDDYLDYRINGGYYVLNRKTLKLNRRVRRLILSKKFRSYTFETEKEAKDFLKKYNRIKKLEKL